MEGQMITKKSMGIKSVRAKVILALVIGFLIFGSLLLFTYVTGIKKSLTDYFDIELESKYSSFRVDLNNTGNKLYKQIQFLNDSQDLSSAIISGDSFKLSNFLRQFRDNQNISAIHLVDDSGKIVYSTESNITDVYRFRDNKTFKDAKTLSPIYKLSHVNDGISYLVINRYNVGTIFSGYAVIENILSSYTMVQFYKDLLGCEFTCFIDDKSTATSIIDENGRVFKSLVIKDKKILDTIYNKKENYHCVERVGSVDYFGVYVPLTIDSNEHKACYFISIPQTIIEQTQRRVLMSTVPVTIICIVCLIFLVILMIMFFILKPLNRAAKAIHQLSDETQEADLTFRINFTSDDEIGHLCMDIDKFLSKQQILIEKLKKAQGELDVIGKNLGQTSEETASAISQIMANIEGVRHQTENQMRTVVGTNSIMESSLVSVNKLDSLIENQSAGITQSSASIEEMVSNIASVTSGMRKMSNEFQSLISVTANGQEKQTEVDQKVFTISEQSKLLMEANEIIAQIASQTNLLAMNAAIEAAHAGDAGAGFSVVADEIRSLAENSTMQSQTIGQELQQIATNIDEAVSAAKQSNEAFRIIMEKISDTENLVQEIHNALIEQDSASKQVLDALEDINSTTVMVQESAKEMKNGASQVNEEIAKITEIAQIIMGSMDEMSAGATQINNSAHGVHDMANDTQENIHNLESLIGNFKI